VAEGIEDRATLELLTSIGCDIGQGYFISRPKPAEDIAFQSGYGSDVETAAGSKAS
jgi:EAL domain-containing protein (putative c-di-GMP-specific phosphodiesterase class I)